MKRIFFILIILILVFITGCNPSYKYKEGESRGGYPDGLRIQFLSPEDSEIYEGDEFIIDLKLDNNADCDIFGDICVSDLAAGSLSGVPDTCNSFTIQSRESSSFSFRNNVYENLGRTIDTTLIAEAIYSCDEVIIDPLLCVRDKSKESEKDCSDKETISGRVPGLKSAPVTVTKIEKNYNPSGEVLRVDIYLDEMDRDNGVVFYDEGNSYTNENFENGFPISVEYGNYGELDCGNYLKNGIYYWKKDTENIIKCKIDQISVSEVEENLLRISLNYKYKITESIPIKVIHMEA